MLRNIGPILMVLVTGCGGSQTAGPESVEGPLGVEPPTTDTPSEESASTAGQVTRAALFGILGTSPGYFFRLVDVEGVPSPGGSAFGGWRILRLPPNTPAWLDVRVGDVVTAVNGMSLEHPEDAQRVYEALRVASEIRLDLTRDAAAQTVSVVIVDAGDALPEEIETPPDGDAPTGSPEAGQPTS